MNETIIRNWNERVKPCDTVIFNGDFAFKECKKPDFKDRLNGNIVFIRGNHDNNNCQNSRITSLVIEIGGGEVYVTHNPADSHPCYKINLVGHVHNDWKIKPDLRNQDCILVNIGVDVWDFRPVSWNEIQIRIDEFNKPKELKGVGNCECLQV